MYYRKLILYCTDNTNQYCERNKLHPLKWSNFSVSFPQKSYMDEGTLESLERYCSNGVCHCDWHLTIFNCEEESALRIINIVLIVISGLGMAIGKVILLASNVHDVSLI